MKKKLLTLLTLMIFCMSFLTGCNLFVTDLDKDYAQVVVKVGEKDGYVKEITKRDILNSYASNFSQYQSYSPEVVVKYLTDQLTNRAILVQTAAKELIAQPDKLEYNFKINDILGKLEGSTRSENLKKLLADKSGASEDVINRLYNTAKNAVIESETKTITDSFNKKKLAANPDFVAPSTEELTKRPTKDEGDKAPVALKDMPDREGSEYTDADDKNFHKQAYKDYVKSIKDSKLFDELENDEAYLNAYFELALCEQLEQSLITEHTKLVDQKKLDDLGAADSAADVEKSELYSTLESRFDYIQSSQKMQFDSDVAANITAIEGISDTTFVLYNVANGLYGYVKHILFKFDDMQTYRVTEINSSDSTTKKKTAERRALIDGLSVKDLRDANEDKDFTPDEHKFNTPGQGTAVEQFMKFFNKAFGAKTTAYDTTELGKNSYGADATSTILNQIYRATGYPNYDAWEESKTGSETKVPTDNVTEFNKLRYEIEDKFIDWEYAYSGDTGSLGSATNMLLNSQADPFLANQKFVKEFSEASRNVIVAGVGTYTTVVTDFGIHLIYCVDSISKASFLNDGKLYFDPALASRIIRTKDEDISDSDKKEALYKIYQVIKTEVTEEAYNDAMNVVLKDYKKGEGNYFVEKNETLYKECVSGATVLYNRATGK